MKINSMKRSIVLSGIVLFGALFFSSCTKNLKDDIRDLQKKIDDISHSLGNDEPITPVTIFKDKNGKTITIADTYKFKANDYSTQYIIKNHDGTYDVFVQRFGDVDWNDNVSVSFNYVPSTKAVTQKYCSHRWYDNGEYAGNATYNFDYFNKGLSFDINLKKIDLTTGAISFDVKINATEEYSKGVGGYYVPWDGTALSTNLSFDGKLRVF